MEESNLNDISPSVDAEPDCNSETDASVIRSASEENSEEEKSREAEPDLPNQDESDNAEHEEINLAWLDELGILKNDEEDESDDAELCAIYGNAAYAELWAAALQIDAEQRLRSRPHRREDGDGNNFFERFANLEEKSQQNSRWNTPSPQECLEPEVRRDSAFGFHATPISRGGSSPETAEDEGVPKPRPRSRPRSGLPSPTSLSLEFEPVPDDPKADALYEQVIYATINTLGVDLQEKVPVEDLWQHLRSAVGFSDEKHLELVDRARQRAAPEVQLHLDVLEGRALRGKDINGLSDPFCTIWVSSNRQSPVNTEMKPETLSPVWKETFILPVKSASEDILTVEVWDYDPQETVKDKMGRINQVKNCRGLKKFVREIAVASSSSGKPAHEFLGIVHIPLKYVPISGVERWFPLDGRNQDKGKAKERGEVRLRLLLCPVLEDPISPLVAWEQHEKITAILMDYDIRNDKEWSGCLSTLSQAILEQHSAHLGLRKLVCQIIRLRLLVRLLSRRWVDWQILAGMVSHILKRLDELTQEEENIFWEIADEIAAKAVAMLRQYRAREATIGHPEKMRPMLRILKDLLIISEKRLETNRFAELPTKITEALTMGAADWLSRAVHQNPHRGDIDDDDRLEHCTSIVKFLMTDLQKVLDLYNPLFAAILQIPAFAVCYEYYDAQLCALCQPVVQSICRTLKGFDVSEEEVLEEAWHPPSNAVPDTRSQLTMGTALFELYLNIQRFHKLSAALNSGAESSDTASTPTRMSSFHTWFTPGVSRWLDIALFNALQRIVRAVLLDAWKTMDHLVQYSSSAVDTVSIFYQVKTFWKQLSWPDPEGALAFVTKIIDDVCRCSLFYAEVIGKHLARQKSESDGTPFTFSPQVCVALNNILHVQSRIRPVVTDLGWEQEVVLLMKSESAEHCRSTINTLVENTLDNMKCKMEDFLENFADEIGKQVKVLLQFNWNEDPNSTSALAQKDALFRYLDESLVILKKHAHEDIFQSALPRISRHVFCTFLEFVEEEIEGKRHPPFFKHTEQLLDAMLHFFYGEETAGALEKEMENKIRELLSLHAMETCQLIHCYRVERMKAQGEGSGNYGALSVRALFVGETLHLEILNAKNLRRMDTTGSCDPYLKVVLLPSERFAGQPDYKTKVHKNTLFPLFDETATFAVPAEAQTQEDSLLWFAVKDHDYLGKNEFCAESFLALKEIVRGDAVESIKEMEQLTLPLTRPSLAASRYWETLQCRTWDKGAKEFVKREKRRVQF